MKRPLFAAALVFAALVLGLAAHAVAAPVIQEQKPVIAQPEANGAVRGVVQIVGTATNPQFQRYELYYASWPVAADNAWIFIGPDAHFQAQPLGLLGTWDSRAVPDGAYALRVRVVKRDGNYIDSEARRVTVANTRPAETPTPTASPTGQASPTATGPAATLPPPTVAPVSTVPPAGKQSSATSGTRAASAAATPAATAIVAAGDTGSLAGSAGQLLDVSRLGKAAKTAGLYTLGAFALVGLFFGAKALLYWLYLKMRP